MCKKNFLIIDPQLAVAFLQLNNWDPLKWHSLIILLMKSLILFTVQCTVCAEFRVLVINSPNTKLDSRNWTASIVGLKKLHFAHKFCIERMAVGGNLLSVKNGRYLYCAALRPALRSSSCGFAIWLPPPPHSQLDVMHGDYIFLRTGGLGPN